MSYLTADLSVAQGVAVYAALSAAAGTARAQGDVRPTGQLMADLLVERVTGQSSAAAVPVEVQVVMTDRALLAGDGTPAQVPGYGTVPAASSWRATAPARPPGATPRSATSTTSSMTHPAARPARTTVRGCACGATTPSSCRDAQPDRRRRHRRADGAGIPWCSSLRPAIGMRRPHPRVSGLTA